MWHKSLSSFTWEVSYETLPGFVSVHQHFGGLQDVRNWPPQTSSGTMNGGVDKVSVGLRHRGSQLV